MEVKTLRGVEILKDSLEAYLEYDETTEEDKAIINDMLTSLAADYRKLVVTPEFVQKVTGRTENVEKFIHDFLQYEEGSTFADLTYMLSDAVHNFSIKWR